MNIVFISNFFNYHQEMLSQKLYEKTNGGFYFVQTSEMDDDRKKMGWSEKLPTYVIDFKANEAKCREIIDQSEVVIIGSADYSLVKKRLAKGKLTFLYYERLFKKGYSAFRLIKDIPRFYYYFGRHKSLYCLCASAYTAYDFSRNFSLLGKCYKWGYFPEVKKYERLEQVIESKKKASILWAGRLIGWKHPDTSIRIAEKLKNDGYNFSLKIIGSGELDEDLRKKIEDKDLSDCVTLLGSMGPAEVRSYMEQSQIYLFTSDFEEGWGVVLNEAMNSACAVVASHAIGSVPYLINDGVNGLIYENGNEEQLYEKVKFLLHHSEKCIQFGTNAYFTLTDYWNAETAAERFLSLAQMILDVNQSTDLFESGPCSKAEIIKDGWYVC